MIGQVRISVSKIGPLVIDICLLTTFQQMFITKKLTFIFIINSSVDSFTDSPINRFISKTLD